MGRETGVLYENLGSQLEQAESAAAGLATFARLGARPLLAEAEGALEANRS